MYEVVYAVLIPVLVGGGAGLVSHLITQKKSLEFPQRYKSKWYLGFIADIIIGSLAAVFAVNYLVTTSDSLRSIIGISILAGISGETVLLRRSLAVEESKNETLNDLQKRIDKGPKEM